jgi:hypothetical protein
MHAAVVKNRKQNQHGNERQHQERDERKRTATNEQFAPFARISDA